MCPKTKVALFLCFFSLVPFLTLPEAAAEEYDPLNTIMALNAAVVSVHSVVTTEDRIVLDQEYKNIINNLKLGEIESDYSIVDLYRQLMDSITSSTLRDEEAKRFKEQYDSLQKRSLVRSMTGVRAYGGSLSSFLGSLLVSGVSAYFGYQEQKTEIRSQLDESLWRLEKDKIEDFNRLQKELLNASWTLLRKYSLPDEYRITQDNLRNYTKALQMEDKAQAVRMFKRLERSFKMYPPFWYHYGTAAYASGNEKLAEECFDEFEKIWLPILRQDPYLVAVIKHRIVMGGDSLSNEKMSEYLDVLQENVGVNDWINNIFIAVTAFQRGEKDVAVELLEANIFFGVEEDISNALLQAVNSGKMDVEAFSEELRQYLMMPSKDSASREDQTKPQEKILLMASIPAPDQNYRFSSLKNLDRVDQKKLLDICSRLPFEEDRMGLGKTLDKEKLEEALESMKIPFSGDVLVLFDSTVWGSNSDGIALTRNGIYTKSLMNDPYFFPWVELVVTSITLYDGKIYIGPYSLELLPAGNEALAKTLTDFRNFLRKKYKEEFAKDREYERHLVLNCIVSWVNGDDDSAVSFAKEYIQQGRDSLLPAFICTMAKNNKKLSELPFLYWAERMNTLVHIHEYYSQGYDESLLDEMIAPLETVSENNPRAQWVLGWIFLNLGRKSESEEYFSRGTKNEPFLQYELGNMFDKGLFIPSDDKKALFWYRMALKGKESNAKIGLRKMYEAGRGNFENEKSAVEEYKRHIAQGSVDATDELGLMYLFGRGVEKSPIKAIEWFKKAAARGYVPSQYNLGLVYGYSEDFPTDYEESYKWFYLAAMNGHSGAKEKVEDLEGVGMFSREKVSPEAQARAKAIARALYDEYKSQK